jgi:hypothetical protein
LTKEIASTGKDMKKEYPDLKDTYIIDVYMSKDVKYFHDLLVKHSRHFYNHLSDSRTPGHINFPTNGLKNNYNTYIETFKKNYVMILNEITHIQHTNKKGETQQYSQNSKDFDAIIQKLKNQMTQRWTNMEKMPYLINELIWYGPNTKLN